MAKEQAPEVPVKRKSLLPKLVLLAALMLVVAAIANLKDIRAIASGEKTFTSVLYGRSPLGMRPTFAFPEPLGPQSAKVKVRVVCQEGNSCHEPLVVLWMAVGSLEPERLRVEFGSGMVNAGEGKGPEGKGEGKEAKGAAPAELGCESGVLINGQTKFEIGSGKEKRVLYLTGPTSAPVPDGAGKSVEGGHGWTVADVATIVNQAIAKAYKQPGKLTAEAINAATIEASKQIPRPDKGAPKVTPAH
ncbi:MAG: hypothetical protein FJX75_18560 [Armatimonadetes bacterium]|nr:hypothetical protein [Armatimonadota bacterium]